MLAALALCAAAAAEGGGAQARRTCLPGYNRPPAPPTNQNHAPPLENRYMDNADSLQDRLELVQTIVVRAPRLLPPLLAWLLPPCPFCHARADPPLLRAPHSPCLAARHPRRRRRQQRGTRVSRCCSASSEAALRPVMCVIMLLFFPRSVDYPCIIPATHSSSVFRVAALPARPIFLPSLLCQELLPALSLAHIQFLAVAMHPLCCTLPSTAATGQRCAALRRQQRQWQGDLAPASEPFDLLQLYLQALGSQQAARHSSVALARNRWPGGWWQRAA